MHPQPVVEAHGTLWLSDLARFHYFQALRRTWLLALVVMLLLPATVLFYVITGMADSRTDWRKVLLTAIPFVLLLMLWVVVVGVFPYLRARNQYRSQKYLCQPVTYRFTSDEIEGTATGASWRIAWSVVHRVRETASLFLLYQSSNVAVLVPKRFFQSSGDLERWRGLALAGLPPKPIEPPGVVGRWC